MKSYTYKPVGPGQKRRPFLIREFLAERGLNMKDLAADIGISYVLVYETIRGFRNNRRVLTRLKDIGCPQSALGLPEDMKERKEAA